jgi:hypothetical protein
MSDQGQIWHKGQLNAYALPNGTFISTDLQQKRIGLVRNNTQYRERLEKAARIAGYTPPELTIARASADKKYDLETVIRHSKLAENATKGKQDEK